MTSTDKTNKASATADKSATHTPGPWTNHKWNCDEHMNEIILNPKGNTYVGELAQRFAIGRLALPAVFKLDSSRFHVFEVTADNRIIHRCSQSTRMAAAAFCNTDDRILVTQPHNSLIPEQEAAH